MESSVDVGPCQDLITNSTTRDNVLDFKNILIIGDSMIHHASKIAVERGAYLECCPGARTEHIKERLLKYENHELTVIHIHVGTNNLRRGYRGGPGYNGGQGKREALHNLADLLFTAKTTFPNSEIFVNSIIIRSDINYKPLFDFNSQVELMCNNFGVRFVEANCWVSRRHLARDGRHLNARGVSRLSALFDSVLSAALRRIAQSATASDDTATMSESTVPESPQVSGNGRA